MEKTSRKVLNFIEKFSQKGDHMYFYSGPEKTLVLAINTRGNFVVLDTRIKYLAEKATGYRVSEIVEKLKNGYYIVEVAKYARYGSENVKYLIDKTISEDFPLKISIKKLPTRTYGNPITVSQECNVLRIEYFVDVTDRGSVPIVLEQKTEDFRTIKPLQLRDNVLSLLRLLGTKEFSGVVMTHKESLKGLLLCTTPRKDNCWVVFVPAKVGVTK